MESKPFKWKAIKTNTIYFSKPKESKLIPFALQTKTIRLRLRCKVLKILTRKEAKLRSDRIE